MRRATGDKKMQEVGAQMEAVPLQTAPSAGCVSCEGALALDQNQRMRTFILIVSLYTTKNPVSSLSQKI